MQEKRGEKLLNFAKEVSIIIPAGIFNNEVKIQQASTTANRPPKATK
jgi:hypothetical protein